MHTCHVTLFKVLAHATAFCTTHGESKYVVGLLCTERSALAGFKGFTLLDFLEIKAWCHKIAYLLRAL